MGPEVCDTLQHIAKYCNTLQQDVVKGSGPEVCDTLQHIAQYCNTLQQDVVKGSGPEVEEDSRVTFHYIGRLAGTHTRCSVLQCVAVCYGVLQCVAVCCSA